ncbi:PAS domain S-box protein [Undibacterium sp. TJN25]|uniref:PAS domain S-box protein n=1 Tax=Undibacterium sp. TJN25 TaxID=3413056 RepID=UPI003BF13A95
MTDDEKTAGTPARLKSVPKKLVYSATASLFLTGMLAAACTAGGSLMPGTTHLFYPALLLLAAALFLCMRVFWKTLAKEISPRQPTLSERATHVTETPPAMLGQVPAEDAVATQQQYAEENRKLALVVNLTNNLVMITNPRAEVEWVNPAFTAITLYSQDEVLGRKPSEFLQGPDTDPETVRFMADKISQGLGFRDVEILNYTRDGDPFWLMLEIQPVQDENGQLLHFIAVGTDVTKPKQYEIDLRISESKFSSAFRCVPDAISITRVHDSRIMEINDTYERVIGYSREETIGKTSLELDFWPSRSEREKLGEQVRRQGIVTDFPARLRIKSGQIRDFLYSSTSFTVDGEEYFLTSVRDVTEQKKIEKQKGELDRALLKLAQGAQAKDRESYFEILVADLASALGVDRAFLGLRVPHTPDKLRSIANYQNGKPAGNQEYSYLGTPCESIMGGAITIFAHSVAALFPKDHALLEQGWESYAGAPIHDTMGNIIGVLNIMNKQPLENPELAKSLLEVFSERASTELERKRSEEALKISEKRFSNIFNNSPTAMTVSRLADYRVVDVNKAFETLFLRPRVALLTKTALDVGMYCDVGDRSQMLKILRAKGMISNFEAWMRRGDGSKALMQLYGNVFTDPAGEKFMIVAFEDVTERRAIEAEIKALNINLEDRVNERTTSLQQANQALATTLTTLNMARDELVRSEKLAALGALVAGIAHELNTPIGNSLMIASTLLDHTRQLSQEFTKGLTRSGLASYIENTGGANDILVRNLEKAAGLISSFKQVAVDQTSSQRRHFDLAELVAEIVLTLSPTIRKTNYSIHTDVAEDIELDSYPGPLGQVLTNLINNAIIHAFDGRLAGQISISAKVISDQSVMLSVQDNGVGIPPENIKRIFDPFFTTKLGAGGSGLGLNITHNIVTDLLGGKVQVESTIGTGTTFALMLPRKAPVKAEIPQA